MWHTVAKYSLRGSRSILVRDRAEYKKRMFCAYSSAVWLQWSWGLRGGILDLLVSATYMTLLAAKRSKIGELESILRKTFHIIWCAQYIPVWAAAMVRSSEKRAEFHLQRGIWESICWSFNAMDHFGNFRGLFLNFVGGRVVYLNESLSAILIVRLLLQVYHLSREPTNSTSSEKLLRLSLQY